MTLRHLARFWPEWLLSAAVVGAAALWAFTPGGESSSPNSQVEKAEPTSGAVSMFEVQLCQAVEPACDPECDELGRPLTGVYCGRPGCGEPDWKDKRLLPFEPLGPGEYVGPHRLRHVPEYRLRVDDLIDCVFRATREELSHAYQLEVGDKLKIESVNNPEVNREVDVQPDGNITMILLGPVRAVRRSIPELTADLEQKYTTVLKRPSITVTPLKMNTKLQDLLDSVNNRFFSGGLGRQVKVMPDGNIYLPAIGAVPAQGLTLSERQREIAERYHEIVGGVEVTPILNTRAHRYVYVVGEVRQPGRYTLEQPTTSMMSIALAGGSTLGGNLREIVVFRRTDDWKLMATRLDLNGALLGKRPCPADEIWVRDSDIVLVPKSPLLRADQMIELVFTRGIYAIAPAQTFFAQKNFFTNNSQSASGT